MVSKEILAQYTDLQQEIKYIEQKIDVLQNRQAEIEKNKRHSSVKASTKEFPYAEHNVKTDGYIGLTTVSARSLSGAINKEIRSLESRYEKLLEVTNDVMDFIESIEDSHMRMIITYRIIENYSWSKVADSIGGGNTEGSVKMAFQRFMERD